MPACRHCAAAADTLLLPLHALRLRHRVATLLPQVTHLADLAGHDGPVWQVAWAHPKYGSLLASASFDGKVLVWKEASDNVWQQVWSAKRAAGA